MKMGFEPFASIQQAIRSKTDIDLIKKVLPRGELNPTLLVNKAVNNPFSLGLDLTPSEFF